MTINKKIKELLAKAEDRIAKGYPQESKAYQALARVYYSLYYKSLDEEVN